MLLGLVLASWASVASAQQIGTALSGAATGDGAAAYYNPAAMALGDSVIELDVGAAFGNLRYDPAGPRGAVQGRPVGPQLTLGGFTDLLHRDVRIGLSLGIPVVSGGDWDDRSEAGTVTRYYLRKGTNLHIGGTLALSWTPVPWFAFGAGAQFVYGSTTSNFDKDFGAELNNMSGCSYDRNDCLFPYADPLFAAPVEVDGTGFGVGATFGVLLRPTDDLELGASVHTPVSIPTSGEVNVTYPDTLVDAVRQLLPSAELPPLTAQTRASLDLPWSVHAGIVYRPMRALELSFYYRWDQQSATPFWFVFIEQASSPSIQDTGKIQGYRNRHSFRLRVGYAALENLRLSLYGGYQTNTVPETTATPVNMDFARVELGLVAHWRINERFALLAQYSHLFLLTRTVNQSLHRPLTDSALANFNHPAPQGEWSGSAESVRLGLQVHFDRDLPAP